MYNGDLALPDCENRKEPCSVGTIVWWRLLTQLTVPLHPTCTWDKFAHVWLMLMFVDMIMTEVLEKKKMRINIWERGFGVFLR